MQKLLIGLLLLLIFWLPATADEATDWTAQALEETGAADLWESLSAETRTLYRTVGVDSLADLQTVELSPNSLYDAALTVLSEKSAQPLKVSGVLLAAVVLCGYCSGMRETVAENGMGAVYGNVSVLAVCAVLLAPFTACIRAVQRALSGAAVFMGSFSPVYIALLTASGQLRAAASYQTVLLLFSQCLTWLTDGVLLPILLSALAMGVVTAVSDAANLAKLAEMLLKGVSWTLGILAAVFTLLLSVNSMLGAAGETLGNKMLKFSIASLVPIVGSAVSEAFLTVKSCLTLAKTTVGSFGILTVVLLLLPAVIQCVCWLLGFWVCQNVAEAFGQSAIAKLLKTVNAVTKAMIGILVVSAVFMIVAVTVVVLAGRGGTA